MCKLCKSPDFAVRRAAGTPAWPGRSRRPPAPDFSLYGVSIKTVAILSGWSLSKHGQPIAVSGCANSLPTKAPNCCSLSPRERVRVRGNRASSLSWTATVFVSFIMSIFSHEAGFPHVAGSNNRPCAFLPSGEPRPPKWEAPWGHERAWSAGL